jgi:hypothetical protein
MLKRRFRFIRFPDSTLSLGPSFTIVFLTLPISLLVLIKEATENPIKIYDRSQSQSEAFADRPRSLQVIASFICDEIIVF